MRDVDTIFESPYSSVTTMEVPEWDEDYIPELPQGFSDEEDEFAAEAFLFSLGFDK